MAGCRERSSIALAEPAVPEAARGEIDGPLGQRLDAYMKRLEAYGFSGSLLVAQGGKVVLDKGYGWADSERHLPYTAATLFDIASISKQFTAAAVLKLEMEGKLTVEDPIAKFFHQVPPDKQEITLHQLLTHTSGLDDHFGDEYEPITRDEFLRRALASRLLGRPGKRHRYSNAGYGLLAAVVEIASGEPLGAYMRERLFRPAGLFHTGYSPSAADRRLLAHGYSRDGDWGTPLDHPSAPDGPHWNLRGNGGVLSTTGDLYRWHLALAGDAVLSAAAREKYIHPYVSEGRQAHADYAYGWSVSQGPKGTREISHIGGNGVFESDFRRYLDDGVVIVISSNRASFSALAVSPHIENRIYGLADPDPPAGQPVAAARVSRWAGVYALPSGDRVVVSAAGGRLIVAPQGRDAFWLLQGPLDAGERDTITEREEKVDAMLRGELQGDFTALARAMGESQSELAGRFESEMAPLRQRLGRWKDFSLLGTFSLGGHPSTYARLTFEQGTKIAEYGWAGPTIETVRYLDAVPGVLFLPESTTGFAAFDVRTGLIARLSFEPEQGGNPATLAAATSAGELRAKRLP